MLNEELEHTLLTQRVRLPVTPPDPGLGLLLSEHRYQGRPGVISSVAAPSSWAW